MKNYKSKILIGVGLITMMACQKGEKFPVDKISAIYVFDVRDSAGTNALKYLLNVYQIVKNGQNRVGGDFIDAASDDAISAATGREVTILATGGYSAIDLPSDENVWSTQNNTNTFNYWNGIRYATEFIDNIGVVPVKDPIINGSANGINVSTRYVWRNEARVLRAYFYFELVKRFGGVPLLGNKVYNVTDNLAIPRSSFDDCIKYIVGECDAAKDSLITYPLNNNAQDNYRITKGAAMALKSRALLYAASPQFNNSVNTNTAEGYGNFSATRWTVAAAAANDVLNLGTYKLDTIFQNVFITQNDPEVIMIRPANQTGPSHNIEATNAPIGFTSAVGQGITNPTQQLVDAYPMNDGKAITDPTSTYDPNNPYKNRDPRLAATILYNGHQWLGTTLQTYEGGASKPNNGQQETLTGYYMRKFMGAQETSTTFQNHNEDWVVFRLAEIKLNYAEAENEAVGASADVYTQLTDLRKRAGIKPGIDNLYGLAAGMTQDQMRTAIQTERRIEMAFEEQRYFDIRRWRIADVVMNQPMMGVSISNTSGNLTYNYIPVLTTRFIAPKMYLYPIPYEEVLKNPNMKQNTGW